MSISIRPASADAHAAWMHLWLGYQRFYKTDISADTSQQTWARLLQPEEPMFAAMAWRDDEAVGLVHWIYHRSCWTTGDYCYLQDLFVQPSARGAGVAHSLIEHVYAQAESQGAARVYWLTHESNTTARALYERIAVRTGFIQYRHVLGES